MTTMRGMVMRVFPPMSSDHDLSRWSSVAFSRAARASALFLSKRSRTSLRVLTTAGCIGGNGNSDQSRSNVRNGWAQPLHVRDHIRISENHSRAGPCNDSGAGVGQPPKSIDQVCHEAAHPHQNCHAEDQSEKEQLQAPVARAGDTQNVIRAHDKVGDKDGEDRLAHAGRYLHTFVTLFFFF